MTAHVETSLEIVKKTVSRLSDSSFSDEDARACFLALRECVELTNPAIADVVRSIHRIVERDGGRRVTATGTLGEHATKLVQAKADVLDRAIAEMRKADRQRDFIEWQRVHAKTPPTLQGMGRAYAELREIMAEEPEDNGRLVSLSAMLQAWKKKTRSPVVETGFTPLDELGGGGLPVGGLTVLAGAPGTGKSALALQASLGSLHADPTMRVLWAAGEMTQEKIAQRAVVAWAAGPGARRISMDTAGARTAAALEVADELEKAIGDRLTVLPAPIPVDQIVDAVVATKAKLAVVDYIQLVTVAGATDRRTEVDSVVRALRTLATQHDVAVLVLSNIARSVGADSRAGQIGKESSEIDFAADILLLGVLQDGHDDAVQASDIAGDHKAKSVLWRCFKNRHGATNDIRTAFTGKRQLFIPVVDSVEEFSEFKDHLPAGGGR
jgi:replicative DNA helicase